MPRTIDADIFAAKIMELWDKAEEEGRKDIIDILSKYIVPCLISVPTIKEEIKKVEMKPEIAKHKAKYRKKPVEVEAIRWDGTLLELTAFAGEHVLVAPGEIFIKTLEGNMKLSQGDYVIKGVNGEFYPCKSDIFHKTYERVENSDN